VFLGSRRAADPHGGVESSQGQGKRAPGTAWKKPIMSRELKLKDGTRVLIRPMTSDDLAASLAFFQALPAEDRAYLRHDVYDREVVLERIRAMEAGRVKRLVAVVGDRIVADAALELESRGWKEHVAELRLIVAHDYQRKGLGLLMARELYSAATEAKIEEIIVKMMRPQVAARSIFRKLGFHEETLLPDYVKDAKGRKQDLILMRCDLEALWSELEDFIATRDWQRMR
jgi:L-amino acid N-acyltransferase YncA